MDMKWTMIISIEIVFVQIWEEIFPKAFGITTTTERPG